MADAPENLFPGKTFVSTVLEAADTKAEMSRSITQVYLMRAAMAGIIIGIFYLANYTIIAGFVAVDPELRTIGKLVGAVAFGFALVFIYFTRSELLTSNMMIATIAVYHRRMRVRRASALLALCLLGNALGGLLIALLVAGSSMIDDATGTLVTQAVEHKLDYVTSGSSGMLDLFVRAILCNLLINLAMLLVYNGLVKADGVKVLAMIVAVMLFAFLGYEHSVANTVLFTIQGFHGGIDIWPALANVGIALVGNFVGGGLLIGWYYAYANDPERTQRALLREARLVTREAARAASGAEGR
ncbi:formate/nitrite transporter family protein [Flavimobilis sp. GY10621]|uniref:Formate/nitrite transporter family protein n=1 Tax=Flavimobilis rhizosphaerae TaxID=2775421 RepID=A0ABR9DQD7_9MICO|nr:formate/nitrite transporter family protein [Flavimobilis rhizosphaerae]MBD9699323.1 formate/nitrite transporter family protein [Flavimobilis rhizosphaerae]